MRFAPSRISFSIDATMGVRVFWTVVALSASVVASGCKGGHSTENARAPIELGAAHPDSETSDGERGVRISQSDDAAPKPSNGSTANSSPDTEIVLEDITASLAASNNAARSEATGGVASPLRFRQAAAEWGLSFDRFDDHRGLHRILEANGGGVAVIDYDGDGWQDLYFTNGRTLPHSLDDPGHHGPLFRSIQGMRLENVAVESGLKFTEFCQGCAVGDFDEDGFDDLYVAAYGRNHLFRNNGDGTFSDVTESTGTAVPDMWSSSVAFADVNLDGVLDLYVVNYVRFDKDSPLSCPAPGSPDGVVQCPPTVYAAEPDVLFLGDGSGGFLEATAASGIAGEDGKGLGIVVTDANQDGWPDLYVANDGTPNFLYMNRGGERTGEATSPDSLADDLPPAAHFEEQAGLLGAAVSADGVAQASMGIAHGDVDGDGWIDLHLSHFESDFNTLYLNQRGLGFQDETRKFQLAAPTRPFVGFGTEFLDADNDGRLDLFVANGHVDDYSWGPGRSPYRMKPQLFMNQRGRRFIEVSSDSGEYFQQDWLGRGVARTDIDHDGDVDLAISHQLAASELLLNESRQAGKSVTLHLIGRGKSNRSAFHARVESSFTSGERTAKGSETSPPERIVCELAGGGGYYSASDRRLHIGLGNREAIDELTVIWPSGHTDRFRQVQPGSYTVVETSGELVDAPF